MTLLDPKRDSGSISNLIAILKDAEKPIPDVLANWGSGGYSSYRGGGGSYGGGNSFGQSASDHREYNNQVREAGQGYAPIVTLNAMNLGESFQITYLGSYN